MTKLTVILAAAVAIVVALPANLNQQQLQEYQKQQLYYAQQLTSQIQRITTSVVDVLQNYKLDGQQAQQLLVYQANQYAYQIQQVIYQLQQGLQGYQQETRQKQDNQSQQQTQPRQQIQWLQFLQGQPGLYVRYQNQLQQIIQALSQIAHSVQQAINVQYLYLAQQYGQQYGPQYQYQIDQLRYVLLAGVQGVSVQAQRLYYLIQIQQQYQQQYQEQIQQQTQQQQQNQQNEYNQYYANYEILNALGNLLAAVHRIQFHVQIQNLTQEQYVEQVQNIRGQILNALQGITGEDAQTAQSLALIFHQGAQNFKNFLIVVQRQAVIFYQPNIQQALHKFIGELSNICNGLDQTVVYQGTLQAQITEFKNQIKSLTNRGTSEFQQLVQTAQNSQNIPAQQLERQRLNTLVQVLLADGYSTAYSFQFQLQMLAQQPQQK